MRFRHAAGILWHFRYKRPEAGARERPAVCRAKVWEDVSWVNHDNQDLAIL